MEESAFAIDTILIRNEYREFEKRWFYIKELFWAKELTQIFLDFIWPLIIGLALSIGTIVILNIQDIYLVLGVILLLPIWYFLRNIFFYIFLWKIFITNTGIYSFNTKKVFFTKIKYLTTAIKLQKNKYILHNTFGDPFTKIIVLLFISIFIWLLQYLMWLWSWFLVKIFFGIIITVGWLYILIYWLRQCIEHFHPLYIFWNIGKEIEKLINEIDDISIQIQIENRENINYEIFEKWYLLATENCEKIISHLEKINAIKLRINDGNTFSSDKYLNSLRLDTVNIFNEIKKFMEMKKMQLTDIQNGMIRSAWTETEEWKKETEEWIKKISDHIEQFDTLIKKIL